MATVLQGIEDPTVSTFPLTARIGPRGLEIGGCALVDIAKEYGTPAYVLCAQTLRARAREYLAAFSDRGRPTRVLFASKAFPARPVFEILSDEGLGFEVASAGELFLALSSGLDAADLVFHGNAKDSGEIAMALESGVGLVVIDNEDDIDRLEEIATRPQPALIRVKPGIEVETRASMATGHAKSKFGIAIDRMAGVIARCNASPAIDLRGLHVQLGSQILDLGPFAAALEALASLGDFPIFDLGGGLGVRYSSADVAPSVSEYANRILGVADRLLPAAAELIVEPGRSIVAPAVVSLYEAVSVKRDGDTYVAVDGGMGDNLGTTLHGLRREPVVVTRPGGIEVCELVGKHCESGDVLVRDVLLDNPARGDLIAVPVTGAYTYSLANNYNGVLRAPVVVCADGDARLAIRRERLQDLIARDVS